jgi:hypothetical protein
MTDVRLHVPDPSDELRDQWRDRVLQGEPIEAVVGNNAGIAQWLWLRWRVLEGAGMSAPAFRAITLEYRRELWLWLAGERTWDQCCAGLIGRVSRRLPA